MNKSEKEMRLIKDSRKLPTTKIAEYVEEQLESHVNMQKTYIKDSTDFLRKIEALQLTKENKLIMFCMDVKQLYPSLP